MAKKTIEHSDVINEVFRNVDIMGIEDTVKVLRKARSEFLTLQDRGIEGILKVIIEYTGVTLERLIHGTDKTDERKIAIALSVYFIKTDLGYPYADIKKIMKKDEAALSRYFGLIKSLNPNNLRGDFDKTLYKSYQELNILFTEQKLANYAKQTK